MKEIISTVTKIVNAEYPTVKNKILFKDFKTAYNTEKQTEVFCFNSYAVIDDAEGEYNLIKGHQVNYGAVELDTIWATLTIDATTYVDIRNETILKGSNEMIAGASFYGLKATELTIR